MKTGISHPTQVDVAERAGVSRATVSYVLNGVSSDRVQISDETRRRVLEAIEELGYEPDARAQALRSGSTKTIALIIPDLRNPHFGEYAIGIEQEARAAGYHVLVSSTNLNSTYGLDIFKDLARRRIDGLILVSSFILESEEARAMLTQLLQRGLPVVEMSDYYGIDSVNSDYGPPTREAVDYLLSLGHRRIALIYGVGGHELARDRLNAYRAGLEAAGIPVDEQPIVECGPTIEDGYQAAAELLRQPDRPTAILAINDLLAIGALRASADAGLRVPEDVSLVGYDDIPISNYMVPRLTTVSKDAVVLGASAFRALLARIQTPDLPRQRLFSPARLVVRESSGPAPARPE